jgi:hypothetical protein
VKESHDLQTLTLDMIVGPKTKFHSLYNHMFSQTCHKFSGVVDSFLASNGGALRKATQDHVRESLRVLHEALERYE